MDSVSQNAYPLWAPDYSTFHVGCKSCGRMISQVRDAVPSPCVYCSAAHYCGLACLVNHFHHVHRPECLVNLSQAVDVSGMTILDQQHAIKDLQLFGVRWRDALGDAAISALDIQNDISVMDRQALVIHLNYIQNQPYRTRRFSYSHSVVQNISELQGATLDEAIRTRQRHSVINQNNGLLGCILVVLTCHVPTVGFIFFTTYVAPEHTVLASILPQDWDIRLSLLLASDNM